MFTFYYFYHLKKESRTKMLEKVLYIYSETVIVVNLEFITNFNLHLLSLIKYEMIKNQESVIQISFYWD